MSLEELVDFVGARQDATPLEVELAQRLHVFVLGSEDVAVEWQHPKVALKNRCVSS